MGYPETLKEIYNLQQEKKNVWYVPIQYNGYLFGWNFNCIRVVLRMLSLKLILVIYGLITWQLLQFDATDTDVNYFTAEVSFKYTIYDITDLGGTDLWV